MTEVVAGALWEATMNRRFGLVLAVVVVLSCSSTDSPNSGGAGASAVAGAFGSSEGGAGAGGHPAGGGPSNHAGASASAGATAAAGSDQNLAGAAGEADGAGEAGAAGDVASGGKSGANGNAGAAGAPVRYCDTHALIQTPVVVTERFYEEYVGDASQFNESPYDDWCDDPVLVDQVGSCTAWRYTPATGGGTTVRYRWYADPTATVHGPACLAPGATRVSFAARGMVGGEVVGFSASRTPITYITLSGDWKYYSVSLAGVAYNTDEVGLNPAFQWIVDPAKNAGVIRFAVADIKYVSN